eukprot:7199767-Pyramimonas_sp.AAC.1
MKTRGSRGSAQGDDASDAHLCAARREPANAPRELTPPASVALASTASGYPGAERARSAHE